MKKILYLFFLIILGFCSCNQAQKKNKNQVEKKHQKISYSKSRKLHFKTELLKKDKAPQSYSKFDSINKTIKLITYQSDTLQLKALLDTTNIQSDKKKPAIVYLHGGFSLGYSDVYDCKPFIEAGFVVLAPSYRGENGNPGYFELFGGEVDDAKAAINWLSKQPYIDDKNIYVFGHSIGGGMSLLLSLHDDIPIRLSGSSSGIYDEYTLEDWAEEEIVPFDYKKDKERLFRLPVYTLHHMVRRHFTYIGSDDYFDIDNAFIKSLYIDEDINLTLVKVKGDHFRSLSKAMKLFIKEIRKL